MIDRTKRLALWLVPLLVLAVGWQFTATAYLIGWCLCIYVVARAAPAIRADYRRIREHFFPQRSWRF